MHAFAAAGSPATRSCGWWLGWRCSAMSRSTRWRVGSISARRAWPRRISSPKAVLARRVDVWAPTRLKRSSARPVRTGGASAMRATIGRGAGFRSRWRATAHRRDAGAARARWIWQHQHRAADTVSDDASGCADERAFSCSARCTPQSVSARRTAVGRKRPQSNSRSLGYLVRQGILGADFLSSLTGNGEQKHWLTPAPKGIVAEQVACDGQNDCPVADACLASGA